MDKNTILIILIFCFAALLAIAVYLLIAIRKRSALKEVYSSDFRDYRFASSLLKLYFKDRVIRNPYLRKNLGKAPLKADVILVLNGGIVIITVLDKPGYYSTPPEKSWSRTTAEGTENIENAKKTGAELVSALGTLLMKAGIEYADICHIVLLSDDHARVDSMYSDGVLTGNELIPFCKKIASTRKIKKSVQKEMTDVILRNHRLTKIYAEKNVYENSSRDDADNAVGAGVSGAGAEIPDSGSEK